MMIMGSFSDKKGDSQFIFPKSSQFHVECRKETLEAHNKDNIQILHQTKIHKTRLSWK